MKTYTGTKIVNAVPMSRIEFADYNDDLVTDYEGASALGYLVEVMGIGHPNHPKHENYINWIPQAIFDSLYRELKEGHPNAIDYPEALKILKKGGNVRRRGWNGKGMFVFLARTTGTDPYFVMHTAQDTMQPGWLATQADQLAEDWEIVELQEITENVRSGN